MVRKKMKKIIVTTFLTIMLLMISISSAMQTTNKSVDKTYYISNEELPEFYITSEQSNILNNYIETNFEGDEKQIAQDIVNNIINEDLKVDLVNLSNYLEIYIYTPINETELASVSSMDDLDALILKYWGIDENGFIKNLFGPLLIKIVEFIKNRLGWIYDLFDKSISLFYNSITLLINTVKPLGLIITVSFVAVINNILSAPKAFYQSIKELFQLEDDDFIGTLTTFSDNFAANLSKLIDDVLALINNQEIKDYFNQLQSYFDWLDEKHWKDKILISGSVKTILGEAWTDVNVTCRSQTTKTDNFGEFSFYVDQMPDEDSFPEFEYYGMHNCQITLTDGDNVLKETPIILSYAFSGGEINWSFIIPKVKTKVFSLRSIIIDKLCNIHENFYTFFSIFL
jgi:hypothetical protein